MGVLEYYCVVMFVVMGFCLQAQALNSQNLTCNSNDLKALQGFLKGLDSEIVGWDINSSAPNCCNWEGITCNSSTSLGLNDDPVDSGRVVKLDLGKQRLTGELSESLGHLDQLRTLNLSHNFLRGPLPALLLHLPKLEVIDLNNNDFSNQIPTNISLPSIRHLDMSDNSFSGSVPVGICDNSPRIRGIYVAMNYFHGHFPPGFGNCSSLEHLCVGSNYLTGGIPEDVFGLPNLERLSVQDNMLSGELSTGIGNLSHLIRLDISSNGFSGLIPDVFHKFLKLQFFSAQSNNFYGHIPFSLANSQTLESLSLRNNSLEGPLDLNCSAMTNLVSLDIATNQFSGPIPGNLSLCPRLQTLNLARNYFTGQIPESFKNFPSLTYLSISNSTSKIYNLSAALQILQHCPNLTTLVLTMNFHGEELPADPALQFTNLKALIIANCGLTGLVPQWLSGSKNLQLLDLSWNYLRETIPVWLGDFQFLFYLDLSNNSFTGEIPKSLTGLQSLIFRNISLEEPSPDFPFFVRRNVSARGLQYNQLESFPPTLDLSDNFLTGPIWPEFGNLKKVHVFELKCNNLSGSIPSNLSGMTSLESLDLSHNHLSGIIPSSLESLSFLSKFNIAYNQLNGVIPSGGQFPTFPNSSFEGNLGLCGEHALPCPTRDPPPGESQSNSKRKRATTIGMAVGIGFGTACVLAIMFLIVLRVSSRKEVDPEREEVDPYEKALEECGSRLVVLFQNKENNKELSLDDLMKSTDNFDQANIIGCGGFGLVYKAALPDGRKVAIKRLSGECGQMEREFQAEVEALSRAQHPNLVLLQGYCMYKNDRLLIYSYMENGSLDYWLHEKLDGPSSLDWDIRLQIAQGAARGLAYLHQSCEPHILHRDIKSSNILLDENFEAHLADFGLARLILPYDTHVSTDLVGTLGYIPPEYGQASVATYKGDVYSFGVVLLELLTGKRPMDMCKPKGSRDLISWVIQMKNDKRESEVFDPFIYDKLHGKEMSRVLEIACLCLSEYPKGRPSTQQLVFWLDNIINVNI
ncbi:phytosulfokine receptor 1-like [Cornus florida]|uniref:phytosulfokine receptor 1-like n=1 Tax=Cornus florida TaxID=4283 RepID=UPI00289992B5|nr:phytosulfokine receptor 1-like [Cornus florida]